MRNALLTTALLAIVVPQAAAHHSFAVFFDDTKSVTVSGSVTHFRFTNPHAIIEITARRRRDRSKPGAPRRMP